MGAARVRWARGGWRRKGAHHRYRHVSDVRQEPCRPDPLNACLIKGGVAGRQDSPSDLAHDVFPLQPLQTLVQLYVVYVVVVALGEEVLLLHDWSRCYEPAE